MPALKTLALSCLLLVWTPLVGHGQTPQPSPSPRSQQKVQPADETDVVRVTTNLIQIDAVVTDSKGKVVTNLKPEDFEILVNGQPQSITTFSVVSVAPLPITRSAVPGKTGTSAPPGPFCPSAPLIRFKGLSITALVLTISNSLD